VPEQSEFPAGATARFWLWRYHVLSILAVAVFTYLPAVDNFFISDDFTLLQTLEVLGAYPMRLLDMPSELFRVASYIFFGICFRLFGLNPEPYYWAGIGLHALVSLLVFALVFRVTSRFMTAWIAAVFFAAYERHHEAVMWISAFNDAILALNCVVFLLLWERTISKPDSILTRLAAFLAFGVALFSKEAAVALVPLAVIRLVYSGYTLRDAASRTAPLVILLAIFVAFWLSQATRNFFVVDGHYQFGWHFVPVYFRSIFRLLTPALLFAVPLGLMRLRGRNPESEAGKLRSTIFFLALIGFSVIPYSFLTYLDHIPSRNTYFPSVGLAGVVGLAFAGLYARMQTLRMRRLASAFMVAVIAGNVGYIWIRKEPQFRERAAPTTELIAALNDLDPGAFEQPLYVCGFPLHEWIGQEAVRQFTSFAVEKVLFLPQCDHSRETVALDWDRDSSTYEVMTTTASAP
jgi:hypothetical protein